MGWDIVGEIEGSGVTSPGASHRTSEGLPQLGALPDLKNVDILLVCPHWTSPFGIFICRRIF